MAKIITNKGFKLWSRTLLIVYLEMCPTTQLEDQAVTRSQITQLYLACKYWNILLYFMKIPDCDWVIRGK